MIRFSAIAAAFLLILGSMGCDDGGPPLGSVTGQVTMDGKPLPNALVAFVPEGGGSTATGSTDANGNYELVCLDRKGAPIGKHKVSVTTAAPSTTSSSTMTSDSPDYAKQASRNYADYSKKVVEPIPAKYNSQTTLVQEVKSGNNVINLALDSK
jgi:hypothetical protein